MLLTGLGVFGVASLLAAIATSSEVMLLARFLSGVGAAMIMPVTLAVITSTFPAEERAKAIGIWTGVAGGGGILGMYLSAVLVDLASWRWLFALPVILVVLAGWQTLRSIPKLHPGFSLYVDREVHDVPIEITGPCQIRTGDHGVVEIANRLQSCVASNPLLTLD
jgi:MFS family permease